MVIYLNSIASSTMASILRHKQYGNNLIQYNNFRNKYYPTECGFTIIRDPIERFISGYYTVNQLVFQDHDQHGKELSDTDTIYKFYKIEGEPQRFRQFVDDLITNKYNFIKYGAFSHIASQTGILSMSQVGIQFIIRKESLLDDYNIISEKCGLTHVDKKSAPKSMVKVGRTQFAKQSFSHELATKYLKMLGLINYSNELKDPAWYALDKDTYNKIINYMSQDYECFKFTPNYKRDVLERLNITEITI